MAIAHQFPEIGTFLAENRFIAKDLAALDPPDHYMVDRAGGIDSCDLSDNQISLKAACINSRKRCFPFGQPAAKNYDRWIDMIDSEKLSGTVKLDDIPHQLN